MKPHVFRAGLVRLVLVAGLSWSTVVALAAETLRFTRLAAGRSPQGWVDGVGAAARFNGPATLTTDAAGNVFIADPGNESIRVLSPDGRVSTLAKPGQVSALAIDAEGNVLAGVGTSVVKITRTGEMTTLVPGRVATPPDGFSASVPAVTGLTVDASGTLYLAEDTSAYTRYTLATGGVIRKRTPDGTVSVVAGNPEGRWYETSVDGVGAEARFNGPGEIALGSDGNLYVAERGAIRRVTPGGTVTTVLRRGEIQPRLARGPTGELYWGNGGLFIYAMGLEGSLRQVPFFLTNSGFSYTGLTVASSGRLYVSSNDAIVELTGPGPVHLAGARGTRGVGDGWGGDVAFRSVAGFGFDAQHNVYVVDNASTESSDRAVRRISPAGVVSTLIVLPLAADVASHHGVLYVSGSNAIFRLTTSGELSVFAGEPGVAGYADGVGRAARFWAPIGLGFDGAGNLYTTDAMNNNIRKIAPDGTVTTLAGRAGAAGSTDGAGDQALFRFPMDIAVDAAGNVHVGDPYVGAIRKVTPGGVVTTIEPSRAVFSSTFALDPAGNLVFARGEGRTGQLLTLLGDGTVEETPFARELEPGGLYQFSIAPDGRHYLGGALGLEVAVRNAAAPQLVNLSARATVNDRDHPLITGVSLRGPAQELLLRAVGPALAAYDVTDALSDTRLEWYAGQTRLDQNAGWGMSGAAPRVAEEAQRVGAFALPAGSLDSALLASAAEGTYTAVARGDASVRGSALAELYVLGGRESGSRVVNTSARGTSAAGRPLIVGLTLAGDLPQVLLLRGAGPALNTYGVGDAATGVRLELYSGQTLLASNAAWSLAPEASRLPELAASVGAFPFARGSEDAALVVELRPGRYTLHVTADDPEARTVLAEVYPLETMGGW